MTSDLQFIICPQCAGQGEKENKKCAACQGFGVVGFFSGYFLIYGEQFNFKNFWQIKFKKFFKKVINFLLLILGLVGIFILILAIFQFNIRGVSLSFEDLLNQRSWLVLIFWFSLLSDMYLFYRLEEDLKWQQRKIVSFIKIGRAHV